MQRLWEILLGFEPASWTEGGRWSIDWLGLPGGDGLLALAVAFFLATAALWWLFRREAPHVSRGQRILLAGLRSGVLLAIIAMLLEPVIVLSKEEFIPSNLLVLLDTSRSMEIRDAWPDEPQADRIARNLGIDSGAAGVREHTRLELARRFLSPELREHLAGDGERIVRLHTFSDRLGDAANFTDDGELKADGETTAIGAAIRQALLEYAGMPVSGILLVTDGQSTSGEPAATAASLAEDESVPVVGVAVGTPEGPQNAAITDLEAAPVVFVRDTNRVTVHIQSRGMQSTPAALVLEQRRDGGPWEELGREQVVLELEGTLQTVPFDFSETRPARLEFRARLDDLGPELSKDDNVVHADVRVVRQRLHVLFIAGSTFPEVQFLRNSLIRDRAIELSSWLQSADSTYEHPGDAPIRRLPVTQEELNDYDCVVLYDPDPNAWPTDFPQLLNDFVSKFGGGLVYIAGEMQTSAAFDRQSDPALAWLDLLPVIREPGLFRSQVQVRLSARSAWKLQITPEGERDPVFAFSRDAEANRRILDSLPGMYWHFPLTRAKPGAAVLAVHGDPRMRNEFGPEVLLATQLVGPGRTIFAAFDSTYRWRFLDEQFFDGFWARLIDRAGRNKQLGGAYPFRLSTPQASYKPGSSVKVLARFQNPADVDPGLDVLHGEIEHGDSGPVGIALTPTDAPGEFAFTFTPERPGTHVVRVWMGDEAAGALVKAATLPIDVRLPSLEYENPGMNRAQLEAIAAATGGKTFDLASSDELAEVFRVGRVSRVLEHRQEIWDAPLLIATIFLLLVTEWILRKRFRMI